MVLFYISKIQNEEINPSTGSVWEVNDVPKLWRSKVEVGLKK